MSHVCAIYVVLRLCIILTKHPLKHIDYIWLISLASVSLELKVVFLIGMCFEASRTLDGDVFMML